MIDSDPDKSHAVKALEALHGDKIDIDLAMEEMALAENERLALVRELDRERNAHAAAYAKCNEVVRVMHDWPKHPPKHR